MTVKQNMVNIAAAIALYVIALLLEAATDSLRRYIGPTFNFQLGLWGYVGITMLFSVLIFVFFLVAYKYQPPDRWVYACFLAFAAGVLIVYVLTYMIRLDFLYNLPFNRRISMALFAPGSLPGIATMTLFWAGLGGLILPVPKK